MPMASDSYFNPRYNLLPKAITTYGGISSPASDGNSSTASYNSSTRPSIDILQGETVRTGRPVSFIEPVHGHATSYRPTLLNRFRLFLSQLLCIYISTIFLLAVVVWALLADISARIPSYLRPVKPANFPWDDRKRWKKEKCVKDVRYYARAVGFDIVDEEVETEDGFYLRMHRVVNPRHTPQPGGKGGFPVLILHGLFQSSGAFITSEERSFAFWLSEHGGYQVFLGNTRGVFNMGHRSLSQNDPRFWDWTIRELAMYDFPALVEYVCDATGYDKIAFIGHSQGNAIAFLALSVGMRPEIGQRLSCFIALAPAVYAGQLTHGFPFTTLSRIEWSRWKIIFGVLDFIPIMRYSYNVVPAKVFAGVGYAMFAYLFSWTDANWLKRRKTKIFRFTPTPVSSASIFWYVPHGPAWTSVSAKYLTRWCGNGGFAQRKCTMDDSLPEWFDRHFPPLAIYHGGHDFLVAAEPLIERIRNKERHVRIVRIEHLSDSEHCDFYLAAEAVEWCFASIVQDIEATRSGLGSTTADSNADANACNR